jgi:glycine/D-amino acid oxidase-like deaminating enzyme
VLVVGAGLVGLASAWLLQRRGHPVLLVDPAIDGPPAAAAGSWAALGVLMAQVFHRSSGRAWRLRQRSHALWPQWLAALEAEGHGVASRSALVLLASSVDELARQQRLAAERQRRGLPLELWSAERLQGLRPRLPAAALGGLHSPGDGQLDPAQAMAALLASARIRGLTCLPEAASRLERTGQGSGSGWRLIGSAGSRLEAPWLVLCAGVATAELLETLGHSLPTEPVLGQALELELEEGLEGLPSWSGPGGAWPGAVVWRGVNLVPRPDLSGGRRLWLGATLEPGRRADPAALSDLRGWGDAHLNWLSRATVVRHWAGQRCRPCLQPAPVLEVLEPGLVVASGHYRNGVLLAPATAEWVAERIAAGREA